MDGGNAPNPIVQKDLYGWVQNHGLNLPKRWRARPQSLGRCHDRGEPTQHGGMVRTQYSKGHGVDTSNACFLQLPGSVPGAFRPMAILIGLGRPK